LYYNYVNMVIKMIKKNISKKLKKLDNKFNLIGKNKSIIVNKWKEINYQVKSINKFYKL
jgi:hypothetical protein